MTILFIIYSVCRSIGYKFKNALFRILVDYEPKENKTNMISSDAKYLKNKPFDRVDLKRTISRIEKEVNLVLLVSMLLFQIEGCFFVYIPHTNVFVGLLIGLIKLAVSKLFYQ